MAQSKRFRMLKKELNRLRQYFLPKKFDPLGSYTERQLTHATAYRMLVHAEIEAYLEDRVKEVADAAIQEWSKSSKVSRTLLALLAFSGMELESPPDSLTPSQSSANKKLEDRLQLNKKLGKVYGNFLSSVKDNHGIKENNILSLLLPVGIDSEELDRDWLNLMDDFGEKRGLIAHTSASSYKTTQPIDPKQELDTVNRIIGEFPGIKGLMDIDKLLNELMK